MTRKDSRLEKAASRIMDLDSPAYGDERERAVSMEARAYGITVGIYLSLVVALVSAILGQVLLAVVLLLTMSLPNWAAIWYARRHDVDIEGSSPGSTSGPGCRTSPPWSVASCWSWALPRTPSPPGTGWCRWRCMSTPAMASGRGSCGVR